MPTLAVQFYDVIVWLHVSAVVLAFGPTFAYGIYFATAGPRYPRSIPAILEAQNVINRTMVTIGAVVILVTGIYLAADRWDFGYFFVTWGLVAIIVLLGLVHGFFLPNDERGLRISKRDIEAAGPTGEVHFSDEHEELTGRNARMGPVAGLIVILTIYVMAAKPFL